MAIAIQRLRPSLSGIAACEFPFRAMVPQFDVEVDRIKTQTAFNITTDRCFLTAQPPTLARLTSISSTNSAAPFKSTPKPMHRFD